MSTIGDTPSLIGEALLRAIGRVDFIIVTGGLGSTDDDLTNEAVSQALDRPTMPNLEILARIRDHLKKSQESVESPLEKLAWLPSGADPFFPARRIAGYQLIHGDTPIFFLPGVPEEMKDLMKNVVLPKLSAWQAGSILATRQRVYKVFGMNESEVNRRIGSLELNDDIKIGYYPVFPDVHVSILSRNTDQDVTEKQFDETCRMVERAIGEVIYGTDQDELESIVGELLLQHDLQLAAAESCTGGLLSHRITRVPGSSAYFKAGTVSYANDMKAEMLGVDPAQIEASGAVSHEVAEAMAKGAIARSGADLAISITGIAGPDGGTESKPVGTVYFGIADKFNFDTQLCRFSGDRQRIQTVAAHYGLNMLRLYLVNRAAG
jgi:nicotinamide-nucleotide amidase